MAPINSTSVALFGGYWSQSKTHYFMNDLWIYTIKVPSGALGAVL